MLARFACLGAANRNDWIKLKLIKYKSSCQINSNYKFLSLSNQIFSFDSFFIIIICKIKTVKRHSTVTNLLFMYQIVHNCIKMYFFCLSLRFSAFFNAKIFYCCTFFLCCKIYFWYLFIRFILNALLKHEFVCDIWLNIMLQNHFESSYEIKQY